MMQEYSNFSNIEWKLKQKLEEERKQAQKENPFVELLHEQDNDEAGSV